MIERLRTILLSCLVLAPFVTASHGSQAELQATADAARKLVDSLSDQPLADFQLELLETAFDAATVIPINPHIKSRSRQQEAVAEVCLQLDQPRRALRYIEQIDNWRRGAGYADFAFYCVRNGHTDGVEHYLYLAEDISKVANQDWRRDRIRVKVARTYVLLGSAQKADQIEAGIEEDSETGKVAAVEAMISEEDAFDQHVEALDRMIVTDAFELIKNAQLAYVELYNRFYDDQEKRALVEQKIKASCAQLPLFMQIDLLSTLAGFALDHGDQPEALRLVNEAQQIVDSAQWPADFYIPMMGRLSALRFRAGDQEKARADVDAALAMFHDQKDTNIASVKYAQSLRPLAEAYHTMGDEQATLAAYKLTVDQGAVNPNARPRAEDLSATCSSMALLGVEPDDELWTRIREIREGLGHPW